MTDIDIVKMIASINPDCLWRHKGTGVEVRPKITKSGNVMATCAGKTGCYSEHPALPIALFLVNYTKVDE